MPSVANHEDSENDLDPALANIRLITVDPVTEDVEIIIDRINKNIDNSPLDPNEVSKYKIYCFSDGLSHNLNLGSHEALWAQRIASTTT